MMTKTLVSLALAAATLAPAHAAGPKETVESFHAALGAGDKQKALALLAPEVAIYEAGHVERSRDEYASAHLGSDIEFARVATRKVLKQTERVEGNTAIVWEETETSGTFRGKDVHAFGTGTMVLEKRGDSWAIVHIHWSSRKAK